MYVAQLWVKLIEKFACFGFLSQNDDTAPYMCSSNIETVLNMNMGRASFMLILVVYGNYPKEF